MTDKPYRDMIDDELANALAIWEEHTENASGWSSAYFSAQQVAGIVDEGNRRGLGFVNRFPINRG